MSWEDDSVEMLRIALNDLDAPYTYDDERLQKLFLMACMYVQKDVQLNNTYIISITEVSLSPDPTTTDPIEYSLLNMAVLKSLCILYMSDLRLASGKGVDIRDGGTQLSLKNYYTEKSDNAKTACELYLEYKDKLIMQDTILGEAIVTPFTHDRLNILPSWLP